MTENYSSIYNYLNVNSASNSTNIDDSEYHSTIFINPDDVILEEEELLLYNESKYDNVDVDYSVSDSMELNEEELIHSDEEPTVCIDIIGHEKHQPLSNSGNEMLNIKIYSFY